MKPPRRGATRAGATGTFIVHTPYKGGAPAGTPRPVLDQRSGNFKAALESPAIRGRMVRQGAAAAFPDHEDFSRFLAAELPCWAKAVKDSGAKPDHHSSTETRRLKPVD